MTSDLIDKIVVITGAAEGIGFAIAEAFLERGARVILLDVNEKLGIVNTGNLNAKYDNRAIFWKCDVVTDLDDISQRIFKTYKKVDVLVNNAGIAQEFNPKKMMDINILAVIEWTRRFWEHMRKGKGGNGGLILNVASVYGYRMDPWLCVYKATKFAVVAFSRSFGDEFHFNRSGVRICALCPGFTHTNLVIDIETSKEKEVQDAWIAFTEKQLWQETSAVSRAAMEVYDKAKSGTAWVIEGDQPIFEIKQYM